MHQRMVLSVNTGQPREIIWERQTITTAIYKFPVAGRVTVRSLNINGDRQADLRVHGGMDKAVYAYPSEHYLFWREEFPEMELPWGTFGENLTTHGLLEEVVCIGDRYRIGTAEFMVTQPRLPCFKLGIRFGRKDIIKRFLDSQRTGFYLAVMQEGELEAGDEIEIVSRDHNAVTVQDLVHLYLGEPDDPELRERAIRVEALPERWRTHLLRS